MSDQVRGRLLLRGEDGYEEARVGRIFNARRPDRFPAAILEVTDERDVVAVTTAFAVVTAVGYRVSRRLRTVSRPHRVPQELARAARSAGV